MTFEMTEVKELRVWLRCTVNTRNWSVYVINSPPFRFLDCEWILCYLNVTDSGKHILGLSLNSYGVRPRVRPFDVRVQLKNGRGQIVLSQERCFTDEFECSEFAYDMQPIWEKKEDHIIRAFPQFRMYGMLRFLVVLKPKGDFPSSETQSVSTQSQRRISVENASQTESTISAAPSQPCAASCFESLSEDFSKLLMDDPGSNPDVEFECGGRTFKAHRLIVCARSPVIASMMGSDMIEGRTGKVKIPNVEPDNFEHFLRYLYSGQLPKLTVDLALSLYESGDQYEVHRLATRCSKFLVEHLTVQNACRVLAVADAHSAKDFKEAVVCFVLKEQIPLCGEHWQEFCRDHPNLAIEVLNRFCQKQSEALKAK